MTITKKTQSHFYGLNREAFTIVNDGKTKNKNQFNCSLTENRNSIFAYATDYFTINYLKRIGLGLIVFLLASVIVSGQNHEILIKKEIAIGLLYTITITLFIAFINSQLKRNRFKKGVFIVWDSVFYKKVKRLVVAGVLFVFNLNTLNAQEVDSTATNSLSLRPLSELIEAAIQNAPELRNNQVDYARQALAYKIQKRNWVDNLSINGTSLYGNGSVVDYSNAGSSSTYVLSDRKSLNFNIGVGIRITGGDIVNRGAKAEMQRLQLDHIQNERQIIENRIREVVINVYSQLELALKVVKLRSEVVENQRLVLSIAEKYFKEGNYKPADYSSMLDKITAAQEQFEQAKADAKKLALLLKNITNVSVWE